MNDSNWIEIVAAIGSLLSGIGIFAAAASLIYLARQTRASVYQGIVAMGNSINDMFLEKPELYNQIFGDAAVHAEINIDDFPSNNPQCFFAAQKYLDYFELILVTRKGIPKKLQAPWENYIKSHFINSALLRAMVNTDWYGKELQDLCELATREKEKALNKILNQAEPPPRPTIAV
ncbi:MAG TPA: hypothetical protein VGC66_07730 [Pyrinomonadaceae bacterium]